MAQSLINSAGKRLFSKHMDQYRPTDTLYEEYTDARGRVKRRKRELPTGLSQRDLKILRSVNRRAHYLDKGFNICGLRFGWTFVIGIIPGAGDAADAVLGYVLVIRKARQAEIPSWLIQRMLFNLAVGTSVGLVPIVGDVMLAAWRANSRNAALLEEYLRQRANGRISEEEEGGQGSSKKTAGKSAATAQIKPAETTTKGKAVDTAGPATPTPPGGPSPAAGGTTPARSGSSGSRRWMNWRRPSKDKGVSQVSKRESRFVEDMDSSPPRI